MGGICGLGAKRGVQACKGQLRICVCSVVSLFLVVEGGPRAMSGMQQIGSCFLGGRECHSLGISGR